MKLLITGATGFLGGEITRRAVRDGHDVRVLVRKTSRRDNIEDLPVEVVEGDILKPETLGPAIRDRDAVIHTAASVSQRIFDKDWLFKVNVEGTRNVLAACHEADIDRVVYTSTIGAVGMATEPDGVLDEEASWNLDVTKNPYVASKHEAEEVAREFIEKGLDIVILNPGIILGPNDVYGHSTRLILEAIRGNIPGYLEGGMSFVHVGDCAEAHVAALTKGRVGERYILCGINKSQKEFFETVAEISGAPAPRRLPTFLVKMIAGVAQAITYVIPPLRRTMMADFNLPLIRLSGMYAHYDCSKAEEALGYEKTPLETMVREALEFHLNRGDIEATTDELKALASETEPTPTSVGQAS